jgi:tetratricopeptide (TPR) repeat protein
MGDENGKDYHVLKSFSSRVDREDPGALNNLGVLYFRKEMYQEAIEQFKAALKLDPRFDLARENLQFLFSENNIDDPDVKSWKEKVEKDPEDVGARHKLGISYQNMGKFSDAAEMLGMVVDKEPDNLSARIHLGSVLKAQGLYQQALEHFQFASEDVEKSAALHTDLGEIYYNLGRTEEAVTELRKAIKIDADYWRAHFLLSFAYGDFGRFQDALEESRTASRLNPSFKNREANLAISNCGDEGDSRSMVRESSVASVESTSFTIGVAYRERGYIKEALKEFNKALQDMADKECVHLEIGKIYLAEREYNSARRVFDKVIKLNPKNDTAYLLKGCTYHVEKKYKKAGACYVRAYRLNTVNENTMNNLGVLMYQVGLREDGERFFKMGLNHKLYNKALNYNFLNCNIVREDYMMAENLLQRLEAFMGKDATVYEKRALLNFKMNRMTLALFDIESALSIDSRHVDAIYLKGLIFLREENLNEAIDTIVSASKIRPSYTGYHFRLAVGDRLVSQPLLVPPEIKTSPDEKLIDLMDSGMRDDWEGESELVEKILSESDEKSEDDRSSHEGNREYKGELKDGTNNEDIVKTKEDSDPEQSGDSLDQGDGEDPFADIKLEFTD